MRTWMVIFLFLGLVALGLANPVSSGEEGSELRSGQREGRCLNDGQYCDGWSASNPFAGKQCCGSLVCGTKGATLTQWVCQRACANC